MEEVPSSLHSTLLPPLTPAKRTGLRLKTINLPSPVRPRQAAGTNAVVLWRQGGDRKSLYLLTEMGKGRRGRRGGGDTEAELEASCPSTPPAGNEDGAVWGDVSLGPLFLGSE